MRFDKYSKQLKAIAASVGGMGGKVNYLDSNGNSCSDSILELTCKVGRALIDGNNEMIISNIEPEEIAKHENNLLFNIALLHYKRTKENTNE